MQHNNQPFTNSGALFQRRKDNPKAPDMGGDFTIDGEVLNYVMDCVRNNVQVKLDVSGRRRTARDGSAFLSLQIEIPWQIRKGQQQAPAPQPQSYGQASGGYNQGRTGYNAPHPPRQAQRPAGQPQPRQGGYNDQDQNSPADQGGFPFDDKIPW